jgi:hypothetical protein
MALIVNNIIKKYANIPFNFNIINLVEVANGRENAKRRKESLKSKYRAN